MCRLVDLKTNMGTTVKVADIKLPCIDNMVKQARHCGCISEIILFGSALEKRCREDSDIDIAIISRYTVNKLSGNKEFSKFMESVYDYDFMQEYDRLYFSSLEEIEKNRFKSDICNELMMNGKIVYSRQGG